MSKEMIHQTGNQVIVTRHADMRIGQRLGLPKKRGARTRFAQIAYERGCPINGAKGGLRKWMIGKYAKQMSAGEMRVYGEHCFLFEPAGDGTVSLITVLLLPHQFRKPGVYTKEKI